MKKKLIAGAIVAMFSFAGLATATEVSLNGGVYTPKYDTTVTKNGYFINGSMSVYDLGEYLSAVVNAGYAKSGKSVTGKKATDYSLGAGVKATYTIQKQFLLSGEVGADYHIIDIKNNGIIGKKIKGVSPYVKVGADYAFTKTAAIGVSYKQAFGKAKSKEIALEAKALF